MRIASLCLTFAAAVVIAGHASANITYVESVDGEIGVPNSVTDMGVAGIGINTVTASIGNTSLMSGFDADVFSFMVAAGQQLDSISFTNMQSSLGQAMESAHLIALNDGPVDTNPGTSNLFIGLVTSSFVGQNFLTSNDDLFGNPAIGAPLGPGTYHVWFQETNTAEDVDYTLEFTVSAIPEPTSSLVVLIIGASATLRRSR